MKRAGEFVGHILGLAFKAFVCGFAAFWGAAIAAWPFLKDFML